MTAANYYRLIFILTAAIFVVPGNAFAADDGGHHLPHNHIAIVVGKAHERASDGHEEDGGLIGIEWEHQFSEHWGVGLVFEQEAFGERDETNRHGILAVPVSYHLNDRWRIFGAVGVEFRKFGEADEALFRLGSGYEFELGEHLSLAPEIMIDFVSGGGKVYVIALAFGYGF